MTGTSSGVSGSVQYDASVMCFNDEEHQSEDGVRMVAIGEQSDKGNDIFQCSECGIRRAVNLHVAPLQTDSSD